MLAALSWSTRSNNCQSRQEFANKQRNAAKLAVYPYMRIIRTFHSVHLAIPGVLPVCVSMRTDGARSVSLPQEINFSM